MAQNSVVPVQEKAVMLRSFLHSDNVRGQLEKALPKWLSADRLLRIVFSTSIRNPKILECTRESILQSVMMCAQLGLEPILGRAYLIPYNNKKLINGEWTKILECQFQPGYQGLIDLARRSDSISDVYGSVVYEKDEFDYSLGTNRKIHHKPTADDNPGGRIGAYAVWILKDGTIHPEFMFMRDIKKRRDKSQSYQYAISNPNNKTAQDCPWIVWPEEMELKTVIKHSSKMVPASIEFMEAVRVDDDAETGRRYVSPFVEGLDQLPEKTAADFAADFDDRANLQFANDPDGLAQFSVFVDGVAKNNGKSLMVVKADVMRAEDFENLFNAFEGARKGRSGSGKPAGGSGGQRATGQEAQNGAGKQQKGPETGDREVTGKDAGKGPGAGQDPGPGTGTGPGADGGQKKRPFDEKHPWFRSNWIFKKNKGLEAYVHIHAGKIADMPMELFTELSEKFSGMYKKPFPYDPDGVSLTRTQGTGSGQGHGTGPGEIVSKNASDDVSGSEDDAGAGTDDENGPDYDENAGKTDDGPQEDIGFILESQEGIQLSGLARRFPVAYKEIVQNRIPKSIAQVKEMIAQIDELVAFTGEEPQGKF